MGSYFILFAFTERKTIRNACNHLMTLSYLPRLLFALAGDQNIFKITINIDLFDLE
jgi:hypothetical protein